jgi:hypothetical protein
VIVQRNNVAVEIENRLQTRPSVSIARLRFVARIRGKCRAGRSLFRSRFKQRVLRGLRLEGLLRGRRSRWGGRKGHVGTVHGIHIIARRLRRRWRKGIVSSHGQPGAVDDGFPKFLERDSLLRVTFEDASQDHVQLGRDGQNRAQELGVLQERAERGILR